MTSRRSRVPLRGAGPLGRVIPSAVVMVSRNCGAHRAGGGPSRPAAGAFSAGLVEQPGGSLLAGLRVWGQRRRDARRRWLAVNAWPRGSADVPGGVGSPARRSWHPLWGGESPLAWWGFRVAGEPALRWGAIGGILGVYRQVPTTGGPTDG